MIFQKNLERLQRAQSIPNENTIDNTTYVTYRKVSTGYFIPPAEGFTVRSIFFEKFHSY